ncbi:MAG: hypothetical protein IJ092_12205 [Atopobiaceae bacterium]|nr:hypothetical protein [Atopobiaceae bacterium]MBR1828040.1 hypothetical protein [Atopobiaceae bacterium]
MATAVLSGETNRSKSRAQGQVNVRMNAAVKDAGDEALAEVGLSPSEVVRALWEAVGARGEKREQVLAALGITQADVARKERRAKRQELVSRMAERYGSLGGTNGVDPAALPALDDEAWDELAWEDYIEHRAGAMQ